MQCDLCKVKNPRFQFNTRNAFPFDKLHSPYANASLEWRVVLSLSHPGWRTLAIFTWRNKSHKVKQQSENETKESRINKTHTWAPSIEWIASDENRIYSSLITCLSTFSMDFFCVLAFFFGFLRVLKILGSGDVSVYFSLSRAEICPFYSFLYYCCWHCCWCRCC